MRDKKRIKSILDKIQKIWERHEDMRFTQLLINLGIVADDFSTWNIEDTDIEERLDLNKDF